MSRLSACKGVLVRVLRTEHASRPGASKVVSAGGETVRFQKTYSPRRYSAGPVSRTYCMSASSRHSPEGWYGLTEGPPTCPTSSPLAASAWSRIISADRRKRGPRASRRLSGSRFHIAGVVRDDWR